MINNKYKEMLNQKSVIREIFMYGRKRALEIGYDNVFDYSLGNPSVETVKEFDEGIKDIINNNKSTDIHGYSPTLGLDSSREITAKYLSEKYGLDYTKDHIFMTNGAASSLAHAFRSVNQKGDEILTFAPYFPEYTMYVDGCDCKLVVVDSASDFTINFDDLLKKINKNVTSILLNSPNNPTGVVYDSSTLTKLASILKEKEIEYNHPIYIISDEPYREIIFNNVENPYISKFYDNTISCYSYSKSISLPGERIGYVAVNPNATDATLIINMCGQISRGIGHNCPSSLIQLAVNNVIGMTSDISVYEKNMNILYDKLTSLGFEVIKPGGTFYMFVKCLESDATSFCNKALEYDLLLVPSDSFGAKGYFRIAYCIETSKVLRSLDAFEKLANSYN